MFQNSTFHALVLGQFHGKHEKKKTKLENVLCGHPLMHSTGASQDVLRHLQPGQRAVLFGKSRSCLIEGLRPQVEVYALITSKDDWAVSLSEECAPSAPHTLLFGACVHFFQRGIQIIKSFVERIFVNVDADQFDQLLRKDFTLQLSSQWRSLVNISIKRHITHQSFFGLILKIYSCVAIHRQTKQILSQDQWQPSGQQCTSITILQKLFKIMKCVKTWLCFAVRAVPTQLSHQSKEKSIKTIGALFLSESLTSCGHLNDKHICFLHRISTQNLTNPAQDETKGRSVQVNTVMMMMI